MKKSIFILVLAMIMLFASCGKAEKAESEVKKTESKEQKTESVVSSVVPEVNDYLEHTYNVTEILDYLKIDGRYAVTKSSVFAGQQPCITFDNTDQLLAFNADCEGNVVIDMSLNVGGDQKRATHYFTVYVDGVEQPRVAVAGKPGFDSEQKLTVATGLAKGPHSFKVYRQSELLHGTENFISITMNGVPTERPKDSKLFIEVLGDSITAGYGNLTETKDNDDPMQPSKSDGTKAYAFLTAQKLEADLSVVARSGLAYSYDPAIDYWKNISFARNYLGKYDFKRQPDIVIIALGTNDSGNYKSHNLTLEDLQNKAVELLKQVRKDCPKSKIVWAYGMGQVNIGDQIDAALKEVGGEEKGFYCFKSQTYWGGGGWHPKAEEHEKIAEKLAEYLKSIM